MTNDQMLSMCTKMINNDKHVHNWIQFNEIGSAGVKYFSTETVSTAKCETLWYSDLGYFNEKKTSMVIMK